MIAALVALVRAALLAVTALVLACEVPEGLAPIPLPTRKEVRR